jgi:hypothetical protein
MWTSLPEQEKPLYIGCVLSYAVGLVLACLGIEPLFLTIGTILFTGLVIHQKIKFKEIIYPTTLVMSLSFISLLIVSAFVESGTVYFYSGSLFYTIFLLLFSFTLIIRKPYSYFHFTKIWPEKRKVEFYHFWITSLWTGIFALCLITSLTIKMSMMRLFAPILILAVGYFVVKISLRKVMKLTTMPQEVIDINDKEILTLSDTFDGMTHMLNIHALPYTNCKLQYKITGEQSGTWHFLVQNETVSLEEGPAESPQLSVTMDFNVWMELVNGETSGEIAFTEGKLFAQGDFQILAMHEEIFDRSKLQNYISIKKESAKS